jgi:hypothetical protein
MHQPDKFPLFAALALSNIFACVGALAHSSIASVGIESPLEFNRYLSLEKDRFERHEENYGCAWIKEIPKTLLCLFPDAITQNRALGRASSFVEGNFGNPTNKVIEADSSEYQMLIEDGAGIDLRVNSLKAFFDASQKSCILKSSLCPTADEKDFIGSYLLSNSKLPLSFTLITVPMPRRPGSADWRLLFTHELSHALFYESPRYREAITEFFNEELSPDARKKITQWLSASYDSSNTELIINEFQAFLFEDGQGSFFQSIDPDLWHRALLWLKSRGVEPISLAPQIGSYSS